MCYYLQEKVTILATIQINVNLISAHHPYEQKHTSFELRMHACAF